MAAAIEASERRRKRKRESNHKKLLTQGKVEVRSIEEGFLGSWHTATVIACKKFFRTVQYDHLLCDDGSENLIEYVKASPMIDGVILANGAPSYYRGLIRPLPPPLEIEKLCLHYGQCVDMFHQDAWWEGVIFDHEDGHEERKIFFPDIGDELNARIEMLRITQDWNEVTEEWKPRGNWVFLELIEELKQEWPLLVAVKQIWYELRVKKGFNNLKEWTCSVLDTWRDLVLPVIMDNFKLTCKDFFHQLNSSGELVQEGQELLELSDFTLDSVLNPEAYFDGPLSGAPFETTFQLDTDGLQNNSNLQPVEKDIDRDCLPSVMEDDMLDMNLMTSSIINSREEALCVTPPTLLVLPSKSDEYFRINSNKNSEESFGRSSKKNCGKIETSTLRQRHWLPAGPEMVPGAEFCPDAINEYINKPSSKKQHSKTLELNARKHLSYLGWKIEFLRENNLPRFRYISPDGKKLYMSLRKLCQELREPCYSLIPQDNQTRLIAAPDYPYSSPISEQPRVRRKALVVPFHSNKVDVEPEYCPQAVMDYYLLGLENNAKFRRMTLLKAKKHLSAVGWSFYYNYKINKREIRYRSRSGKSFNSLRRACKFYIDNEGFAMSNSCNTGDRQNINVSKEVKGQLAIEDVSKEVKGQLAIEELSTPQMEIQEILVSRDASPENRPTESSRISVPRELVDPSKVEAKIRELQKKRKNPVNLSSHLLQTNDQGSGSLLLRKRKEFKNRDGDFPSCVLQSSKRAREVVVPSSSHQTPRTIFSWLIDNNVVLPRTKVYYCSRKDGHPMAEGRITRVGIKCNCCKVVFNLSNFEVHAGSTIRRPSAHIILEDGRSLLECQLQLKRTNNLRRKMTEPREIKSSSHRSPNDYICSACHCGGELVLCDQCPSSYHISCLGLNDVPDGDWFCPSCCCGICGESRFNKNAKQFTDNSVLNCEQCERQYHIGCLRKKGLVNLDGYPKEKWFCNKRCEQVCSGLQRLLGKPVVVGEDNLTWTLIKYMKSDSCSSDSSDIDTSIENYSKLNVALDVMHECFEPVKEPRTRRDLVEDIIFNRQSDLSRLNFRGFYSVFLERNDELITVATVRVYGSKVAEVPLVGTRFQYRRLGMCRILMNELEKKLKELGVERIVLPAVPSVLNTWTTSFGFSIMTESEGLNFLDYTFLNFQGTIMCQKLLMEIPSTGLSLSKGTDKKQHDSNNENNHADLDGNSVVSEVFEADQIESDISDQGRVGNAGVNDNGNGTAPVIVVDETTHVECNPCQSASPECSVRVADQKEGDNIGKVIFKCYKRRRISASKS